MESIIKWKKGEPQETGSYIVSIKTKTNQEFTTTEYWNSLKGKWQYWNGEVVAWCKLREIEPYKEKEYE